MCVCGRVLHVCGFGLCMQVCVCVYRLRLVSVHDASRVSPWFEYEDFEDASPGVRPGVGVNILSTAV